MMSIVNTGQKAVLLVDDDDYTQDVCTVALTDPGIKVIIDCNGKEGVTPVPQHRPSVVLLDIAMRR